MIPDFVIEVSKPVLGATAGVAAKWAFDRLAAHSGEGRLSRESQQSLSGTWNGKYFQLRGPDGEPFQSAFVLELRAKPGRIDGSATIEGLVYGQPRKFRITINGRPVRKSFLQLDYVSDSDSDPLLGTIFLRQVGNASGLVGAVAGYGSFSKRIISGAISVSKVEDGQPLLPLPEMEPLAKPLLNQYTTSD